MTGPVERTRRELLTAVGVTGAAAVAGCGALDGLLGKELTVDGGELVDAVSGEHPGVRETVPVAIERSFVADHLNRAESLLSSVPAPLDRTDVPNGVVREAIVDRHEEALEALDTVAIDERDAETLDESVRARGRARKAAASWAAADDDLTAEAVRDEVGTVRSDVDAFRERWRYVGDDPVQAVVTYGVMEEWLEDAPRVLTTPDGSPNALWIGEFAGNVESARTTLENLRYLFDRHVETLSAERSLQSTFLDTGDRLDGRVDRRKADLSSAAVADARTAHDEGSAESPAHAALGNLAVSFRSRNRDRYNRAELAAAAVLAPHQDLTAITAFEWLRDRIEADQHVRPTGIEDVRQLRTSAIEAIRRADGGPTAHLRRQVLAVAAYHIGYGDEYLRDAGRAAGGDGVSLQNQRSDLARYVRARALAEGVGAVSETVATELRSG